MTDDRRVSGHVASGPLQIFHDAQGQGPHLLLPHGGMGSIAMFDAMRLALNRHWTPIGIEQQGRGSDVRGLDR